LMKGGTFHTHLQQVHDELYIKWILWK
jgi:hypothetical protein